MKVPDTREIQAIYEKWWLGKKVKGKLITKVIYHGNLRYGRVEIFYNNNRRGEVIFTYSSRPRKYNLAIDAE